MALAFLRRRGASLVARNLRSGRGEIDLLVRHGGRLIAVEVKTRVGEDPLGQMTAEKRRRLLAAARAITPRPERVDVVTVQLDRTGASIRWLRGVGLAVF